MKIVVYDSEALEYAALLADFNDVEIVATPDYAEALEQLSDADALFALAPRITDEMVARAAKLCWIQALTSGVDTFDRLPSLNTDVVLSSTRGVHAPQMAELAIMLMLALSRKFPVMLENQKKGEWVRWQQRLLWNRTICIIGLGAIANGLAERCRSLGMRVLGVSTQRRNVEGFDAVYTYSQMAEAFSDSDYTVLLAPYSPKTDQMIDAAAFAAMRSDSYFINLARGGIVNEAALLAALTDGTIAGAAMDVFAGSPLAQDDPLWQAPNLIITPHIGGFSDCYPQQVLPILEQNLRAMLSGNLSGICNRVWSTRQLQLSAAEPS